MTKTREERIAEWLGFKQDVLSGHGNDIYVWQLNEVGKRRTTTMFAEWLLSADGERAVMDKLDLIYTCQTHFACETEAQIKFHGGKHFYQLIAEGRTTIIQCGGPTRIESLLNAVEKMLEGKKDGFY